MYSTKRAASIHAWSYLYSNIPKEALMINVGFPNDFITPMTAGNCLACYIDFGEDVSLAPHFFGRKRKGVAVDAKGNICNVEKKSGRQCTNTIGFRLFGYEVALPDLHLHVDRCTIPMFIGRREHQRTAAGMYVHTNRFSVTRIGAIGQSNQVPQKPAIAICNPGFVQST